MVLISDFLSRIEVLNPQEVRMEYTLRLDHLVSSPDINPNPGPHGRPSVKLLVNFNDFFEEIKHMCRNPTKLIKVQIYLVFQQLCTVMQ